jgi:hypothetical protein
LNNIWELNESKDIKSWQKIFQGPKLVKWFFRDEKQNLNIYKDQKHILPDNIIYFHPFYFISQHIINTIVSPKELYAEFLSSSTSLSNKVLQFTTMRCDNFILCMIF